MDEFGLVVILFFMIALLGIFVALVILRRGEGMFSTVDLQPADAGVMGR